MPTLSEQAHYFSEIQGYLVGGALELFGGFGMPLEHAAPSQGVNIDGPAVMAVIGYAAPTVRGALLLLTSRHLVAALEPVEIRTASPSEARLRDVLGEFSNMLVGRVKNRLVTRDVEPLLSTPTTILGDRLELPAPTSGMSAWHGFVGAAGKIFVRLDATFEPAFVLPSTVDPSAAPVHEGDMVLF